MDLVLSLEVPDWVRGKLAIHVEDVKAKVKAKGRPFAVQLSPKTPTPKQPRSVRRISITHHPSPSFAVQEPPLPTTSFGYTSQAPSWRAESRTPLRTSLKLWILTTSSSSNAKQSSTLSKLSTKTPASNAALRTLFLGITMTKNQCRSMVTSTTTTTQLGILVAPRHSSAPPRTISLKMTMKPHFLKEPTSPKMMRWNKMRFTKNGAEIIDVCKAAYKSLAGSKRDQKKIDWVGKAIVHRPSSYPKLDDDGWCREPTSILLCLARGVISTQARQPYAARPTTGCQITTLEGLHAARPAQPSLRTSIRTLPLMHLRLPACIPRSSAWCSQI
ncbi:hypothetical protein HDK77DRAFT_504845 [Phyllosticta capitalensis]